MIVMMLIRSDDFFCFAKSRKVGIRRQDTHTSRRNTMGRHHHKNYRREECQRICSTRRPYFQYFDIKIS